MKNPNQDAFTYCPRCGSPELQAVSAKCFACRSCGFTFFLNCAAAAIGLILTPENKIVVTRRKGPPFKHMLDFPGGFAEPGESIEQALKREIKEELNLDVTHLAYLMSLPGEYAYKGVLYDITDLIFQCRVASFDHMQALDDICEACFVDIADLDIQDFGLKSTRKTARMLFEGKLNPVLRF